MSSNQTEYNILGCTIRVKSDEDNTKALAAIEILDAEINQIRLASPGLKDQDLSVLAALNLASKCLDTENEYKESIFALKAGVEDALKYVELASSSSGQA